MLLWMDRTAFRAVIENERTILLAETESMCNAESEVLRQADKSINGHYSHHGESIHLERHRLYLESVSALSPQPEAGLIGKKSARWLFGVFNSSPRHSAASELSCTLCGDDFVHRAVLNLSRQNYSSLVVSVDQSA